VPLVAHYRDQRVEAWRLDRASWISFKSTYRTDGVTMVCGEPGYPKTSPNGLQFFAHKSAGCTKHEGGRESPEHLQTKALVAAAAERHGFEAIVEAPATDRSFIIDVLLVRGDRRIAVEAQWSKQSDAEFARRTARYEATGLEVLWLVGPLNRKAVRGVRAEHLNGSAGAISIDLQLYLASRAMTLPLAHGLDLMFSNSRARLIEPIMTTALVSTAMAKCWHEECAKWITFWNVHKVDIETRCGQTAEVWFSEYQAWLPSRVEEHVESHVARQIAASTMPKPTYYETRYSKIARRQYIAQNCPYCRRVQGDGFITQDRRWTSYRVNLTERIALPQSTYNALHLCRGERGSCDPTQNKPLNEPPGMEGRVSTYLRDPRLRRSSPSQRRTACRQTLNPCKLNY
jgi:hypothetical protein